ncbi:unnamed protein product [Clonostachys rosea]|uniref:2EXR domain-containing protein n=1 Tax=Bionectria ochroleuca TaxID=29856 RepID=A0ABY6UL79_BIOOC|nr:unnamed protein product [Clonostachys rosea]
MPQTLKESVKTIHPRFNMDPNRPILNPANGTSEFPLFASFPEEIRQLVWEQALSHGRVIHIGLDWSRERDRLTEVRISPDCRPNSKLFRVSSESRRIAQRFYKVHLSPLRSLTDPQHQGTLYLNPALDTLILTEMQFFPHLASCLVGEDSGEPVPIRIGIDEVRKTLDRSLLRRKACRSWPLDFECCL